MFSLARISCSFKLKQNHCLSNLVNDKSQHMCRVLGPASRAEFLRDRYFNKLEIELGNLGQVSKDENTDWLEPSLFPYNPKMLQDDGFDRVYYAIHLLQTDPSVQVQSVVYNYIFYNKCL